MLLVAPVDVRLVRESFSNDLIEFRIILAELISRNDREGSIEWCMGLPGGVEVGENAARKVFRWGAERGCAGPFFRFIHFTHEFFEALFEARIQTLNAEFVLLNLASALFPVRIDGSICA